MLRKNRPSSLSDVAAIYASGALIFGGLAVFIVSLMTLPDLIGVQMAPSDTPALSSAVSFESSAGPSRRAIPSALTPAVPSRPHQRAHRPSALPHNQTLGDSRQDRETSR